MKYTQGYIAHLKEETEHIVSGEKLNQKGILVTGASGLIGSAVSDLLFALNTFSNAGIRIYLAGRSKERMKERFAYWTAKGEEFSCIAYDAGKPVDFPKKGIDMVIHCAANAHPGAFTAHPVATITEAVTGLENILNYAKDAHASVLYVSSSEVYGEKKDNTPYREEEYYYVDLLNPRSCYPSSKRLCETLCAAYHKEFGLEVKIVRPGHIYGPQITANDSRAHAQFLRNVVSGENIVMKSEGRQLRSYCYSLDCASAMLSVLTAGEAAEAYNISNPNSLATIRDLAMMHAGLTQKEVVFDLPTDSERANYNMMSISALVSDKLEALGWSGIYNLEAGVAETIACFEA